MRPTHAVNPTRSQSGQDAVLPLFESLLPSLPMVTPVKASGRLLRPAAHHTSGILAVEFLEGAGHVCPFCFSRSASELCAGGELRIVEGASRELGNELDALSLQPSGVMISPACEPFLPINRVQAETANIVELLAGRGIDALLMTRGYIRPTAMKSLQRHASKLKVAIGVTTLDRSLQRRLEPLSAPPRLRMKNIRQLREAGIACQAALEPLIPGLTDTRENLGPLLQELAEAGIRQVSVGYLVLHGKGERELQATLHEIGMDSLVFDEYANSMPIRPAGGIAGRYLSRHRRQHGYAAIMSMAAGLGMRVTINPLTNPDFTPSRPAPVDRGGVRLQLAN